MKRREFLKKASTVEEMMLAPSLLRAAKYDNSLAPIA